MNNAASSRSTVKKHSRFGLALQLAAAALGAPAVAQETAGFASQRTIGQVTQTGPVGSLFVLNARGATLENGKLTLEAVSPSSTAFADRPVRPAGHI